MSTPETPTCHAIEIRNHRDSDCDDNNCHLDHPCNLQAAMSDDTTPETPINPNCPICNEQWCSCEALPPIGDPTDTPLKAGIEDGQLVIRFGIHRVGTMLLPKGYRVDNLEAFANDVAAEMMRDNDLGETSLDRFLVKMAREAANNGSAGIAEYSKKKGTK